MFVFFSRLISKSRKAQSVWCLVALGLVLSSAAWMTRSDSHPLHDEGLETAIVSVGPMTNYVHGRGQLDAWKSTRLISECYWDTRIISLLPEGTLVKKGDVICELDATRPRDYAKTRRIRLIGIKAELASAELQRKLVQINNRRRSLAASREFEDAGHALREYRSGNEPLTRSQLERKTELASDRLEQAAMEQETAEELFRKGIAPVSELNAENIDYFAAEKEWTDLSSEAALHTQYQAQRTIFSLEGRLAEAEANVDATALRNELSLTQAEFAKLSDDRRFAHYTRYLGYALKSIKACEIRAPHDGRVLYANDWHRRSYGRTTIEEGAEVDYRQAIIDLPDYSRFVIKAWVNGAEINKLEIGQPAEAVVAALGNRELSGSVAKIGRFPTVRDAFRHNVPEYSVTIAFDSEDNDLDGLSPRMDADVKILVQDEHDILQVPIEAIVRSDDGANVIVSNGMSLKRQHVELGMSNDVNVEVETGLDEGDVLVIDPSVELQERLLREEAAARTR